MNKVATKKDVLDELITTDVIKAIPRVGELVRGRIVSVGKNEVVVDLNGLTTGIVRGWELDDESGELSNVSPGDEVTATVLDLENERGMVELSFRAAGHRKAWEELERLQKDGAIVMVKTTEANKGGLIVTYGNIIGFLPVSHLSAEHYPRVEGGNKTKILEKLKEIIGHELKVRIIDVDEANEKLIFSEKAVEEADQIAILTGFEVEQEIEVKITGVVDFGLFVELPIPETQLTKAEDKAAPLKKIEGLIHVSELSWQRVEDPREVYKVGQHVKAKIIEIRGVRVSLSIKQLLPDPWRKADEKYKVNQIVSGKIIKISDFGAFVELDSDIHGLAHISELSQNNEDPREVIQVGQIYEFKILNLDAASHRLGLSRKALVNEPSDQPDNSVSSEAKTGPKLETEDVMPKVD